MHLPRFSVADIAPQAPALAVLRHAGDGTVPLPRLAGPAHDLWHGDEPRREGVSEGVQWVRAGGAVFFELHVADAAWQQDPAAVTEDAYRRLEAARRDVGGPHWWRLWNYLGGIVRGEGDEERYRLFTLGRHRAWQAPIEAGTALPAATAIGCRKGLSILALAGEAVAEPVENPRQLSAWRYPRDYGRRPPSFARASLVRSGGAGWLFVSGTASIIGHESRHLGDVPAQFAEALRNVETVVDTAAAQAGCARRCFTPRNFKLYWSDHVEAARHAGLAAALTALAPTQQLHGQVCRRELAVEIEALYAWQDPAAPR